MAYDSNVTSSILNIDVKRRTWRVDFQRPETAGTGGDVFANGFVREDGINNTDGSPTSGSTLSSANWLITITKEQIQAINGYSQFMPGLVSLFDDLKTEYDASGSLATGSISRIV